MFFGSLRYWLYTIKMDQHTKNKIQHLADILWWKPDPDLRDANVKIKRWVRKKAAIRPKNKAKSCRDTLALKSVMPHP